jgi:hypothetical protein
MSERCNWLCSRYLCNLCFVYMNWCACVVSLGLLLTTLGSRYLTSYLLIDALHCSPNAFLGPKKPPKGSSSFFIIWDFFSIKRFFLASSKKFRLFRTLYPENRKNEIPAANHILYHILYLHLRRNPPVVADLPKAPSEVPRGNLTCQKG